MRLLHSKRAQAETEELSDFTKILITVIALIILIGAIVAIFTRYSRLG